MSKPQGMWWTPLRCRGCLWRSFEAYNSTCDYCYHTGKSRGSSVEECTHYIKRPRGIQQRNIAMKEAIRNERVASSMDWKPTL